MTCDDVPSAKSKKIYRLHTLRSVAGRGGKTPVNIQISKVTYGMNHKSLTRMHNLIPEIWFTSIIFVQDLVFIFMIKTDQAYCSALPDTVLP